MVGGRRVSDFSDLFVWVVGVIRYNISTVKGNKQRKLMG